MSNGPIEPSADMRAFANTCRQMFIALMSEGFTEAQALAVIGHLIAHNGGGES